MKYLLLLLAVALQGCGRHQAAEFAPYVNEFRDILKANNVADLYSNVDGVSIEFAPSDHGEDARCSYRFIAPPLITVRKEVWDVADDSSKRMLIYHELGHCVLGRDHTEERSIMNGKYRVVDFEKNQEFYLEELLRPIPKKENQ